MVSEILIKIGQGKDLSPIRRQNITWHNDDLFVT